MLVKRVVLEDKYVCLYVHNPRGLIKCSLINSKKEGVKNSRPGAPTQAGPTPLVPSASLEAEEDMGVYEKDTET